MDYEKAYKEALERAKSMMALPDDKATMEYIFPELVESKDERIRKEIIHHILYKANGVSEEQEHSWIAYLEKQKEQKPEWTPLEESMEALLLAIEGKWDAIKPTGYMSRRLEDLYDGLVNTFNIRETYLPKTNYTEKDIEELKTLKSKIDASMEQKPAGKQDYSDLTDFERAIHRGFLCAGVENVPVEIIKETAQDCLAHIEQKPAERSEDDERIRLACIATINDVIDYERDRWEDYNPGKPYRPITKYDEQIDWLKSFRPQSHWKPSEEQMDALEKVSSGNTCAFNYGILRKLYNDLKKL